MFISVTLNKSLFFQTETIQVTECFDKLPTSLLCKRLGKHWICYFSFRKNQKSLTLENFQFFVREFVQNQLKTSASRDACDIKWRMHLRMTTSSLQRQQNTRWVFTSVSQRPLGLEYIWPISLLNYVPPILKYRRLEKYVLLSTPQLFVGFWVWL